MEELGLLVAGVFASTEPESRLVMVTAPTGTETVEVTYDVIGLGDDSVFGVRIQVKGVPTSDGFAFQSAELTPLCGRGVTEDGLCV